eukprot:s488_g14.t2
MRCHQDAYGHNVVAQLAGDKCWLLFEPDSKWLGAHRLPFEDSSTFTDVDPLNAKLPAECSGLHVVLCPGDVLVVPRHWFHAVECVSEWSLSLNQWLDAPGDTEERVREAVARCLASPFLEARPEAWWLNPDEELLDTSENIEYLTSALEVHLGCEVPSVAAHAALLRAATRPEVISTIAGLVRSELVSKESSVMAGLHEGNQFTSFIIVHWSLWPEPVAQMYCDRSLPPFRNAEHGYQPGVVAWLRSESHLRRTNTSHSEFGCQPLYSGLIAAAVAGGRRICRRRHHGKSRLQMFSAVLEAPQQRTATEVFVDFDTLVRWLVDMERRRGKDVPRTYRSLDRRVKSLMRRLRARGVELCFIVANNAAPCCSEPEDAHLWLAEEQIRASLGRAGCCWKQCGDGSSPSDVLSRLVQNDPDIAAVFGVDRAQLSPAAVEWVGQGTADVQNEEALQRLAILVDETPQRGQFPISSGECKAATLEDGCFVDAGPAFHWRQAQGSSGMEAMEGCLKELTSFLRQQALQDQICRLPMQARAWLLERALRTAGLGDNWLEEWAELAQKLVMCFDAGTDCDKFQIQEHGLAAAATFLLARSAPLMEEELEALAWTLELMRPRRQPTAFSNSMMASLDKILAEFDEPELDERAAAVAIAFQDILRGFLYLGHTIALQEPWLMEPRDCFDDVLFRKLLLALQSGADLRQRLGGRGLRRPGRKGGSSGAEGGSGNAGLAATRGARLARLLTTALPLASDDEQEKQDKLTDLIQREQGRPHPFHLQPKLFYVETLMAGEDNPDATYTIVWGTVYAAGIIGALWVYGLLQERIMSQPYDGEMFPDSVFLVFCNRFFAIWFGLIMVNVKGEDWKLKAPVWRYMVVSLSNVLATTCQYEALKYVSFPVQMLGKSFKMMPVMLWGIVISSKQYKLKEWAVALGVTWGVTMFLLTGPIASPSGENDDTTSNSFKGLLLLLLFLALDGITSPMQEKLFKEYGLSKYNQILWVNLCSAIVSMITLLSTGSLMAALSFCTRHPPLLGDAVTLSVAQVSSQWFIYSQVKEFGAVVFAATMNVRQLFSIVTSYLEYGHYITALQVLSLFLVFGALFFKSYDGLMATPHREREPLVPKSGSTSPPEVKESPQASSTFPKDCHTKRASVIGIKALKPVKETVEQGKGQQKKAGARVLRAVMLEFRREKHLCLPTAANSKILEIKDDCFNDEVEEPKFSASAWREGFGSRGVTASMPPATNKKLNQLKPDDEATEATEATEAEEKTHHPNAETASTIADATGATDGSGAGVQCVAQRTQRQQKKKPPRGAMWFVPGETETASSRAKSEVMQEETVVETVQEESPLDTDQEVTREASTDDPWQTLEDNRQLAWAFAQSESGPVDVWDQAPDANLKALAWEELEKAEIELSKLKEEGLGLHQEEPLEPVTTEPPQELPIEALRTDILERVRQHRATILVGATGCGKSTRLPQYIMEEPGSKVLVTQPRRVAAVEIAKRVAAERGERVGKNVGYRISGETVAGNGKLQFATIGYVLTWFLAKPEQFASFSHIIIDEVHERGADMELFLLLTKLLMYFFPRPKVILMSATMQPEEFSSYFSDFEVGDPLTVPGRTFPVQEVFLDNLLTDYEHMLPQSVLSMAEEAVEEFDQLSKSQAEILQGLPELAVELVPYFAKKNTTLLIFLPGLVELNRLSDLFSSSEALSTLPSSNREAPTNYKVFVLHSMVPRAEQEEVFKQPTGGCCHIVLASNIAESSLTLPQLLLNRIDSDASADSMLLNTML